MPRSVRCALFVLINCVWSCGLWAQATSCDVNVHPLQGSSVQYKERGNRCEGLYVAEVGSQKLELVSFHWGGVNYAMKPGEKLVVSVPGVRVPVHVRAVAIPSGTYYQMDANLAPGASLSWPVDDVLLPEQLNPSRLGILAFTGDCKTTGFCYPVAVGRYTPGPTNHWVFTIRPSFDVQRVQWRGGPMKDGNCHIKEPWQSVPNSDVAAGQSFDLGAVNLQGQVCVEVNAEGENGWSKDPLIIRAEIPAP